MTTAGPRSYSIPRVPMNPYYTTASNRLTAYNNAGYANPYGLYTGTNQLGDSDPFSMPHTTSNPQQRQQPQAHSGETVIEAHEKLQKSDVAIPQAMKAVSWVLLGLLITVWVIDFMFYWRVIDTGSVLTSNLVVICLVPLLWWILVSRYISAQRPSRSIWAILLGPLTLLADIPPPVRTSFLCGSLAAIAFVVAVVMRNTDGTFRVLITCCTLLSVAATQSTSILTNNSRLIVNKREPLLSSVVIVVSAFMTPLAQFFNLRLALMELIVYSETHNHDL